MKLAELAQLMAKGADAETELFEAIGQRVVRRRVRQADAGWVWQDEAAQCECGLLLVLLPRPLTLTRTVLLLGQPRQVEYPMTHAHLADTDGRLLCPECADGDTPCEGHPAEMCDTPTAMTCSRCTGAARPGADHCLDCRPYEAAWDRDTYLGL